MTGAAAVALDVDPEHLPKMKVPSDLEPQGEFSAALATLVRRDPASYRAIISGVPEAARNGQGYSLLAPIACFLDRDFEGACRAATEFFNRHGVHPYLWLLIGVCREQAGSLDEARRAFASALAVSVGVPDDPAATAATLALSCLSNVSDQSRFKGAVTTFVIRAFDRVDFFARDADRAHRDLGPLADVLTGSNATSYEGLTMASRLLGLGSVRFPAWADTVYRDFALPVTSRLLDLGRVSDALRFETAVFDGYGKPRETAALFRIICESLPLLFAPAARDLLAKRQLPPLPRPVAKPTYKVAFVIKKLMARAHVDATIDIIGAIRSRPGSRLDCMLVGITGGEKVVAQRCESLGVPVISTDRFAERPGGEVELYLSTRDYLHRNNFDAVVWVTSAPGATFALAIGLAPVQIFLAMKYHAFSAPEIDGYLTGGSAGQHVKMIEGRRWRTAQTRYVGLYDPAQTPDAIRIRQGFGADTVVLGCLARAEKMNDVAFLDAVVAILRNHSNTVFLWTGQTQSAVIQQHFEQNGVAGRCHFIGWVDTRLYAQVLDIFLDSFPFPCGVTALQAMAARKPIVLFDSPEAHETGIAAFTAPILNGQAGTSEQQERVRALMTSALPVGFTNMLSPNPDAYIAFAEALIADPVLRDRNGAAMKAFVDEFITDARACGDTYERHIVDIIEDKIAAVASGTS